MVVSAALLVIGVVPQVSFNTVFTITADCLIFIELIICAKLLSQTKKQIDVTVMRLSCPVPRYFDHVMTKFKINNRTGAWTNDVNL